LPSADSPLIPSIFKNMSTAIGLFLSFGNEQLPLAVVP
jgi:hypothetical protein